MTLEKLIELLNYIMENNSWKDLYNNACEKCRPCPKYVDFSLDTRDGQIWKITFIENGGKETTGFSLKQNKTFRIETDEDIKKIYEFLDSVNVT